MGGNMNEPVAYGKYIENAKMWLVVELDADMPEGYIPLYTHPAKTLTDEEIKELSEKHLDMDWQTGVIEFARAILRKAQEK
jgi:hypothetical protein